MKNYSLCLKNYLFTLTILLFLSSNVIIAQGYCGTPQVTNQTMLNNSSLLRRTTNNNSYCLKVYFHVIRRDDGTGGQTIQGVNEAFQILNEDFNGYGISFNWDNTIDYINSSYHYPRFRNSDPIFNINNNPDGIDIYIYDNSSLAGGSAAGVGTGSEFYISGTQYGLPLATTRVISHEMGHVLFLWHTHQGQSGTGSSCPELVNGSNSETCGDYVSDTPADPIINHNNDASTCAWTGTGVDADGQTYNPDVHNIMSYSRPQCLSYFSNLQGVRMRNAIATLPHLTQTIYSNCISCIISTNIDLYIKDNPEDDGTEPNNSPYTWGSQSIWVRYQNDGIEEHQHPVYHSTNPNYVYVKIRNKSCNPSSGNEQVKLYWARTSTSQSWPIPWTGYFNSNGLQGGIIGSITIPALNSGQEIILSIPWIPNKQVALSSIFSFLARIESPNDPMAVTETTNLYQNVNNNNNIALHNQIYYETNNPEFEKNTISIYNPFQTNKTYTLELFTDTNEQGKPIFQEAEVTLKMDPSFYSAWQTNGKQSQRVENSNDEKTKFIKNNNAILDNISLTPNQNGLVNLKFNFLTQEVTQKDKFKYHIIQKDKVTNQIIGGQTFIIKKQSRPFFKAEAGGDKEVNRNENITITAQQIGEPAIYNWYDDEGNLIYTGKDLAIATDIAKKYKLEVISSLDGFKDYLDVKVKLKQSKLDSVFPNSATQNVTIGYKVNQIGTAYLMVIGGYGANSTSNNYILDVNANQININLANYSNGFYTAVLVVNGEIVDAKTLIKQ